MFDTFPTHLDNDQIMALNYFLIYMFLNVRTINVEIKLYRILKISKFYFNINRNVKKKSIYCCPLLLITRESIIVYLLVK
jgi:hypothetical protein